MTSSTTTNFTPVVFSYKVSVKLDDNNFLLWRPQLLSATRDTTNLNDHNNIGKGSWNPYVVPNKSCPSNMFPQTNTGQVRGQPLANSSLHQSLTNASKPVCQLCSRIGHTTAKCYQRFNYDFLGIGATNILKQSSNIATVDSVVDEALYPDSEASAHCTANAANFTQKQPYFGQEYVHMGDGAGFPIQNIGLGFEGDCSRRTS
uniref:Retrotransposon Copia-like N-terminal domain-containing protein n=1 Tax=Cannabis sativa TaxID=3483 RepID=A0A803Q0A8_CANSA